MRKFVLKPEVRPPPTNLKLDYAGELNPQQYDVVTAGAGAHLVIAGAGTGKTRTLIYRLAYLVETGIRPEQILLLTFTRRAAQEMMQRAAALLDGRCEKVQGGTFHAHCLMLLRRYAKQLGYPTHFTLLDDADSADVLDVLRQAHGLHQSKQRFPRKRTLRALFSAVTNRDVALADLLEAEYPQFLNHHETLAQIHEAYATYKQHHALMDYDDLLAHTRTLLHTDEVRQTVASAYRHVLVDEYQDTNRLQADLVQQWASVHGNVMVVGDDAQSIYRFRGADFRNILEFPARFPQARVLKLEQNYRSTQPILDLANHVLDQAQERYEKTLFTEKKTGDLPALVQAPDEAFQSRFVCQMILQMREEGVPLNRMGVLFRSGRDAYDLELALSERQIPFVKYGGVKFSETAHVKDVLAYLKVIENPKNAPAWNRALLLLEGIGPKSAQDVLQWIASAQDPLTLAPPYTSPRYRTGLQRLATLLQTLYGALETNLVAQVEAVVQYIEPIIERVYAEDADKRLQDLERFIGLCANYRDRAHLLQSLALDPIDFTAVDTEGVNKDEPPLVLSTIHSAKGLEFHTVFLIQALDGVLPSVYALKEEAALDEELRLLYVALTRAEEHLFVSYPVLQYRRGTGDYFTNPSRFLADLPEALLEPWTLVEETAEAPPALPEGSTDLPKKLTA